MPINVVKVKRHQGKRSILLMGPSGTGKTYQFRTLIEGGMRGLYVDVEAKLRSIEDLEPEAFFVRALDMPLTPKEKASMIASGASDLIQLFDTIRFEEHEWEFVYFDSLMRYGDHLLNYLENTRGISGFDMWRMFGKKMSRMLVTLCNLSSPEYKKPVHVIGTWGVEMSTDWRNRRFEQPVVEGKMVRPRIPYYFDDVLRLAKHENAETGDVAFIAYTGGTSEFDAKVSSGAIKLPPKILDPNLFEIIEVLDGKRKLNIKQMKKGEK